MTSDQWMLADMGKVYDGVLPSNFDDLSADPVRPDIRFLLAFSR